MITITTQEITTACGQWHRQGHCKHGDHCKYSHNEICWKNRDDCPAQENCLHGLFSCNYRHKNDDDALIKLYTYLSVKPIINKCKSLVYWLSGTHVKSSSSYTIEYV